MKVKTLTAAAILRQMDLATAEGRLVAADRLAEAGHDAEARHQRLVAAQTTPEGAEYVTVGRDGAATCPYAYIWTSKVYRAVRRADGLLTWRLAGSWAADRTAGKKVTGPMIGRAKERAAERGVPYGTHGTICD